jgi:hypothetical protein
MTKFYVDASGGYIGGFDGAQPPAGAIEVPHAPADARDMWNGAQWAAALPVVPAEVTRRAGLQALLLEGVTEAMVEAKIEELLVSPDKEMALIEFRASQVFQRNRPLVMQIGTAMGLDLDALFISAASLP